MTVGILKTPSPFRHHQSSKERVLIGADVRPERTQLPRRESLTGALVPPLSDQPAALVCAPSMTRSLPEGRGGGYEPT
jgi:hypothetical protein